MKCQDCSFENARDIKVCINCGADLENVSVDSSPKNKEHNQATSPPNRSPHPIMTPTPPQIQKAGPSSPPHQVSPMRIQLPKTNAMPPIDESEKPPENLPNGTIYIILATLETLCCCQLFGPIALVLAIMGKASESKGNYHKARSQYKYARLVMLLGVIGAMILIGVLLATILPNVQEAKTRSEISETQEDLRRMATALESFYIDNNYFPAYTKTTSEAISLTPGITSSTPTFTSILRQYESTSLTTPIAYITNYPKDTFNRDRPYCYITDKNHWLLFSAGPDEDLDISAKLYMSHEHSPGANWDWLIQRAYDPTNGTISNGDIWRNY